MSIYLDHAATTPMVEACAQAVIGQMKALGNPSSLHTYGRAARKEVERAREVISHHLGCHASEIIFTGSGTEANNTALKGLFWRGRAQGRNLVVISAIEHHAILDPAQWLADHEGAEVIQIQVDSNGVIDLEQLRDLVAHRSDEIAVISLMSANNETGVIQPISDVVSMTAGLGIAVHSDAVQSFGKTEISFSNLGLTALTVSAHKIGGPLGIGILVLRKGMDIPALLHGGGQERDIRSGTFNAPSIVGFAAAVVESFRTFESRNEMVRTLRDLLEAGITSEMPEAFINGKDAERLPGITNATFPGTESDTLLLLLDAAGIACSTGSACSAGVQRASHVLLAMGRTDITARSSLRFSLGRTNTTAEIEEALRILPAVHMRGRAANLR